MAFIGVARFPRRLLVAGRGPMPMSMSANVDDSTRWLTVLRTTDVNETVARMAGYYTNLGLLSALLFCFTITVLADPGVDPGTYHLDITGIAGVLACCSFLTCVIDCVLIDNTLKMLPSTELAFTDMLVEQSILLRLPKAFFFLGSVCLIVQMGAIVRLICKAPAKIKRPPLCDRAHVGPIPPVVAV